MPLCALCRPYLSCRAASAVAVRPRVGVEGSRGLRGRLHHPLGDRQVRGAHVGPRERPLVSGRLGAAVPHHVAGFWPVFTRLVSVICLRSEWRGRWESRDWTTRWGKEERQWRFSQALWALWHFSRTQSIYLIYPPMKVYEDNVCSSTLFLYDDISCQYGVTKKRQTWTEIGDPRHICLHLLSVPVLPVSVRWWWRARPGPVPVGPAGLLAPRLLLGSPLDPFWLKWTNGMSVVVGVRPTVLVLSVSVVPMMTT